MKTMLIATVAVVLMMTATHADEPGRGGADYSGLSGPFSNAEPGYGGHSGDYYGEHTTLFGQQCCVVDQQSGQHFIVPAPQVFSMPDHGSGGGNGSHPNFSGGGDH